MMKIISHRANKNGPNKDLENTTAAILERIDEGFDVEVDLWRIEKNFFLGHDKPEYEVKLSWINKFSKHLWLHCKNRDALEYLYSNDNKNLNYFFHDNDDYTIRSKGIVWCYPGSSTVKNSVYLFPEKFPINMSEIIEHNLYLCTDYPLRYQNK